MKKYFYSNGQEKEGPVTLEELKQKNIQEKTMIWHEGLDDWKEAENIDELKEIFELIQGNDSYYVGDGYEIDMMGAYQAGVKTIWYNHQKQEKDTSFIDFVVYSDEELLEVVKKLNND